MYFVTGSVQDFSQDGILNTIVKGFLGTGQQQPQQQQAASGGSFSASAHSHNSGSSSASSFSNSFSSSSFSNPSGGQTAESGRPGYRGPVFKG
jgi:hypothetical protein